MLSRQKFYESVPEASPSAFITTDWRAAHAINMSGPKTKAGVDTSKFNNGRVRGAIHDTQRQMACAARLLSNGTVNGIEFKTLVELGSLMREEDCSPTIPKGGVNQTGHREKVPVIKLNLYPACVARKVWWTSSNRTSL